MSREYYWCGLLSFSHVVLSPTCLFHFPTQDLTHLSESPTGFPLLRVGLPAQLNLSEFIGLICLVIS